MGKFAGILGFCRSAGSHDPDTWTVEFLFSVQPSRRYSPAAFRRTKKRIQIFWEATTMGVSIGSQDPSAKKVRAAAIEGVEPPSPPPYMVEVAKTWFFLGQTIQTS